jgi:hypothetical protein
MVNTNKVAGDRNRSRLQSATALRRTHRVVMVAGPLIVPTLQTSRVLRPSAAPPGHRVIGRVDPLRRLHRCRDQHMSGPSPLEPRRLNAAPGSHGGRPR